MQSSPGRFLTIYDPRELAGHAFEGTRDEFSRKVKEGDIIVAGRNFGCGSSREHAPLALIGAGVKVVVAQSFARIFFRNAINVGVLPVVCNDTDQIADGASVKLNVKGRLYRGRWKAVPDRACTGVHAEHCKGRRTCRICKEHEGGAGMYRIACDRWRRDRP